LFHSSLLCTFPCHPSAPTILPSSFTSSCHLFLGLPLSLAVWELYFLPFSVNDGDLREVKWGMAFTYGSSWMVRTHQLKRCLATSFCREYNQLQVHSLLLCIWLQVNLMSYVKLSTYRDFRIKADLLQATDNQNQSVSVSIWQWYMYCSLKPCCLMNEFSYIHCGHFRVTICALRCFELQASM
jgi:hypothetical protein